MSILVLGGRGKTSSRISALLAEANVPFIVASRSKSDSCSYAQTNFDWFDRKGWDEIFKSADPPVKAVYLVAPPITDPVESMEAFIETARAHGVKRFVQLSAANIEAGGPRYGEIHQYLIVSGLEYAVLRPTWFMENFSEQQHLVPIRDESKIYSAAQSGRVPFVSVEDIAAVAFRGLTDKTPHNTDYVILGPELLSYDDVAAMLSNTLGRKITHVKLTVPELRDWYKANGMPEEYAVMISSMDESVADGSEARSNNEVEKVTGHPPLGFKAFAEKHRRVWA